MNSEVKEKGRIAKRIIKILLFTAGFVLITCRFNYALKQTNAVSQSMWKRYSACEGLDTLFVGSSVGWIIVPEMIDSINGTSSFNMSTPSQYFKSSSYVAKFAAKQHPLQRIVLVMGYESLEHNEDYVADRAIKDAQYEAAPFYVRWLEGFADGVGRYKDIDFIKKTDSVNMWFDWVNSFTYTLAGIQENIYTRDNYANDYAVNIKDFPYERTEPVCDRNHNGTLAEDIDAFNNLGIETIKFDKNTLKSLDNMIAYAADNNIDFVVMVSPHRSDYRDRFGEDYEKLDAFLKDFVTNRGAKYLNLDEDDVIRSSLLDEYFTDQEHVNDAGNAIVSPIIAERLRKL